MQRKPHKSRTLAGPNSCNSYRAQPSATALIATFLSPTPSSATVRRMSKPLPLLAGLLGIVALVLSAVYWLTPAGSLPGYLPGSRRAPRTFTSPTPSFCSSWRSSCSRWPGSSERAEILWTERSEDKSAATAVCAWTNLPAPVARPPPPPDGIGRSRTWADGDRTPSVRDHEALERDDVKLIFYSWRLNARSNPLVF